MSRVTEQTLSWSALHSELLGSANGSNWIKVTNNGKCQHRTAVFATFTHVAQRERKLIVISQVLYCSYYLQISAPRIMSMMNC